MAVFYYHQQFWKHLKRLSTSEELPASLQEKINNFPMYSKVKNPLMWIGRLLGSASAVDRTGKFNTFNSSYTPIPDVDGFNKTFDEVCLETAASYWEQNNHIRLMWSGGIDSTCAALALFETKPTSSTISLTCTQASIDEYPEFYNRFSDVCNVITNEQFFSPGNLISSDPVVTGDGGDQIFGSNIVIFPDDQLYKKDLPWETMLDWEDPFKLNAMLGASKDAPHKQPWTKLEKENFIGLLYDHATACPFEVRTCFDMAWWLNFSTKMNYVAVRIPMIAAEKFKDITCVNLNTRLAFYINDDFQRWSLTNQDFKILGNTASYKQPAKDFIFSRLKDVDYYNNKIKESSTPKLLENNWFSNWKVDGNSNYAILDDGECYNVNRELSADQIKSILN